MIRSMTTSVLACCLAVLGGEAIAAGSPASAGPVPVAYTADPTHSSLQFSGTQAGAAFKAQFRKFTATIEFAPDALAAAHFDVVVDTASVDSQDADRDKTIRSPDMFDVAHFPTAHYVTRSFTRTASGYTATGTLSLRGVSKDVPLEFQFKPTASGATLEGTASVNRLDFGVGQGEWKSTQFVGDAIKINFALTLTPRH